jgi:YD repeat-containing protein
MSCAVTASDANGNTLSDAQGRSFTWDFENRLTQAVNPGVGTTTFRYDPFGRRIQKSGPPGTTNYLYDGDNLLEEVDNNGNVLARYTVTRSPDEQLSEKPGDRRDVPYSLPMTLRAN